jgi:endonuclease/exonuclease/phosphatase (EEP) superfamily protein YafD
MQLSIDHVLVSSELQVDNIYVGEDLGSDHLPVLSEFRF